MEPVIIKGVAHIIVAPSEALMKSSLIRSLASTNAKLVVNLSTGVLGILREKQYEYFLELRNGTQIALREDYSKSMACIREFWEHRRENPVGQTPKAFSITNGNTTIFKTSLLNEDFAEFMRQVSYAMKNVYQIPE